MSALDEKHWEQQFFPQKTCCIAYDSCYSWYVTLAIYTYTYTLFSQQCVLYLSYACHLGHRRKGSVLGQYKEARSTVQSLTPVFTCCTNQDNLKFDHIYSRSTSLVISNNLLEKRWPTHFYNVVSVVLRCWLFNRVGVWPLNQPFHQLHFFFTLAIQMLIWWPCLSCLTDGLKFVLWISGIKLITASLLSRCLFLFFKPGAVHDDQMSPS